jgi:hypothetical protein
MTLRNSFLFFARITRIVGALLCASAASFVRLALGAMMALAPLGCGARYSIEALHAMAPGADIIDVCVRVPNVYPDAVVWSHNQHSRMTVADDDWDKFQQFAETADVVYRYDPNAPDESAERLPWPYQTMSCRTLSAAKTLPLPKGMREIAISPALREALVATLMALPSESLHTASNDKTSTSYGAERRFTGQLFAGGHQAQDRRTPQERIEALGQMLRDAVRYALPKVPRADDGPSDDQISIIDTKTGQVIGGLGAGGTIGSVPGGVFIADAAMNSDELPQPTREFRAGESLGEMGAGLLQIGGGTTTGVAGAGISGTGGGAVVGVPMCAAGIALAANGTITFLHGKRNLIIAICHWHELPSVADAQPLAAMQPKDTPPSSAPSTSTSEQPAATAAAPTTTPAKPPQPAAKPVAKPAAKPKGPSGGQTPVRKAKRCGVGVKSGNATTTWNRCSGQMHHAISKSIHKALEDHPGLKGHYKYRDERFVTQAIDETAHKGYQKWHRDLDDGIVKWIAADLKLTPAMFEAYLRRRYAASDLIMLFPNGL